MVVVYTYVQEICEAEFVVPCVSHIQNEQNELQTSIFGDS